MINQHNTTHSCANDIVTVEWKKWKPNRNFHIVWKYYY